MREDGDVNARVWLRIARGRAEPAAASSGLRPACRPVRSNGDLPRRAGEGVERWSKVSAATSSSGCDSTPTGASLRCHLRDPSWFQWPLLEAAIEGNIVADFPLCNKSFNCSYSGHDL